MDSMKAYSNLRSGELKTREIDPSVRRSNAKKLAAGYTKKKRAMECCYLSLSTLFWCLNFIAVGRYFVVSNDANLMQLVWMPLCITAAAALADFISGLAHWGLDTWGTVDTPVFGVFIRSFREHHVDQTAMCKHDFIETNADTTLPLLPLLILQRYYICKQNAGMNNYAYNIHNRNVGSHVFLLTLTFLIAITNEIHKWSHQIRQVLVIRWCMKWGILLSPVAHRRHHKDPFDRSYCITTGWINPLLDTISFWRYLEQIVTALTGAIPRANDQAMLGK